MSSTIALRYYSRTGTTAQVASDIAAQVAEVDVERIHPTKERGYPNWLLRSFVPGSTVDIEPIETDLREADALFIGSPKWTLSCPPVTEFVNRLDATDVPTGVFLTFGGFDEERYAKALVDRVRESGADVRATLLVKRDRVGDAAYEERVRQFTAAVLDGE